MRELIAAMKLSVDGIADRVKAWSDDYGLTPQIHTCVVGGGIARTPAEIEWARFAARTPDFVPSSTLTSALAKDTFRPAT
jgi:hypothetical protein